MYRGNKQNVSKLIKIKVNGKETCSIIGAEGEYHKIEVFQLVKHVPGSQRFVSIKVTKVASLYFHQSEKFVSGTVIMILQGNSREKGYDYDRGSVLHPYV